MLLKLAGDMAILHPQRKEAVRNKSRVDVPGPDELPHAETPRTARSLAPAWLPPEISEAGGPWSTDFSSVREQRRARQQSHLALHLCHTTLRTFASRPRNGFSKSTDMSMRPASLRFGRNGPPSGAAFALVKQLLAERPRHFQEILHDGIVALGGQTTRSSADVPAPGEESLKTKKGKKSKAKSVQLAEATNPVPEGHPFVSGA